MPPPLLEVERVASELAREDGESWTRLKGARTEHYRRLAREALKEAKPVEVPAAPKVTVDATRFVTADRSLPALQKWIGEMEREGLKPNDILKHLESQRRADAHAPEYHQLLADHQRAREALLARQDRQLRRDRQGHGPPDHRGNAQALRDLDAHYRAQQDRLRREIDR